MRPKKFAASIAILAVWIVAGTSRSGISAEDRSWQIEAVSERGVLTAIDGQTLCLSGLWIPDDERRSEEGVAARRVADIKKDLLALIDHRPVRLSDGTSATFDRYGCLLAHLKNHQGFSLQEKLIERGLALVSPSFQGITPDEIDRWLSLEDDARRAKAGLWAEEAMRPERAATASRAIGRTGLIEGRVVRTYSNKRYVYLNFGKDWRTDFTVRLRHKLLEGSGLEPDGFSGTTLRVRGFVQDSRGPLIDIAHLKQIEVIP